MKKISKFLTPLVTATTATMSLGLVGCNKMTNIKQEVLDELMGNTKAGIAGLASVPRPSGYHDKIVTYLVNRIKAITNLSTEDIHVDDASNIYFDLPASKGHQNDDMVILQGHSDMVVAGMTEEQAKVTPIDMVIEDNLLHSRNHLTSIGADDGIGAAIMFYLAKHINDFTHGPIRFLLTSDEEIGMIGAKEMHSTWFLDKNNMPIKWLINIDAEEEGNIYRSCSGNARLKYFKDYETTSTEGLQCVEIIIDGLKGGHSGIDILDNRASADRLAFAFLNHLIAEEVKQSKTVQLIKFDHLKDDKDEKFSANQLISHSRMIVAINGEASNVATLWNNWLPTYLNDYPGDSLEEIKQKSQIKTSTVPDYAISAQETQKLAVAFGTNQKDGERLTTFFYGVIDKFIPNYLTPPKASSNIGPIEIYHDNDSGKNKLSAWTSTRSTVGNRDTKQIFSINWIIEQYQAVANEFGLTLELGPIYYPWLKDEENVLIDYLFEGFRKNNVNPTKIDEPAGVEPAIWSEKSNYMIKCACVGPSIDNAHAVIETLHIDTIEPVVKCIIHALEKLTK